MIMRKILAFVLAFFCLITGTTDVQAASIEHVHNYSVRGESVTRDGFRYCTAWCKCGKSKEIRLKFVMNEHQVAVKLNKVIKAEKSLVKNKPATVSNSYSLVQMLSDSIFIDQPNQVIYDVRKIKIGDIVYLTDGSEGIVTKKTNKCLCLAGTDYKGEIFYDQKLTYDAIDTMLDCIITRY